MLMRQHDYCTGVPEAGHNKRPKMCSLTVLGGSGRGDPKTSQYLASPSFASRGATHLLRIVDQVIDCGLWSVGRPLLIVCVKLLDISRNWNTLS